MDNGTIFIEKYKELEATVRSVYKIREEDSISYYLRNKEQFKKFADEIAYCQRVRNFMQHEKKINDKFTVVPSDDMIEFVNSLIAKIKNKPRCMDACVKIKDIYWCSYSSKVKIAIEVMKKTLYSQIPILENGRVVGVFDMNSLFNFVAEHGLGDIDSNLEFGDIKKYIKLDDSKTKSYIFVKSSLYVDEIEKMFEENFRQRKKIAVAFITDNADPSEPLRGLITPWDILANNDY